MQVLSKVSQLRSSNASEAIRGMFYRWKRCGPTAPGLLTFTQSSLRCPVTVVAAASNWSNYEHAIDKRPIRPVEGGGLASPSASAAGCRPRTRCIGLRSDSRNCSKASRCSSSSLRHFPYASKPAVSSNGLRHRGHLSTGAHQLTLYGLSPIANLFDGLFQLLWAAPKLPRHSLSS